MLKLRILRLTHKKKYTEGVLINDNTNEILCNTLEDPVRDIDGSGRFDRKADELFDKEEKVYGKTAIPYGEFPIEVTWSPAFQMDMVLIKDVPHFKGIRFHWGRTAENSEGCPLVGEKYAPGKLENIGMTDKLVELVREAGNEGQLKIE